MSKKPVKVNETYELYQIIRDFDNPIQIFREALQNSIDENATKIYINVYIESDGGVEDLYIDIWDNGDGLEKADADCFFGLAYSNKVKKNRKPKEGKTGYKGHGTKIYYNAEKIEIASKIKTGQIWYANLKEPLKQLKENDELEYNIDISSSIEWPKENSKGFFLRIKNPEYFRAKTTQFMLNHLFLRDYIKWFSIIGDIRNYTKKEKFNQKVYLKGLSVAVVDNLDVEPPPLKDIVDGNTYEVISRGHYFPNIRKTDQQQEKYKKNISGKRPYYDYYSNCIINETIIETGFTFDFLVYSEGTGTKYSYDALLGRNPNNKIDAALTHTAAERYGYWACKDGVPIEKVDDWIEGGRGIGAYTYIHAFIDCQEFDLKANRGSVRNTNIDILNIIKEKVNSILNRKSIVNALKIRNELESEYKKRVKVEEDQEVLQDRYNASKNRKIITLPDKSTMKVPGKLKSGGYNESEVALLLQKIMTKFPDLFNFVILDYNTKDGIDYVVEKNKNPYYIELKGSMVKNINHALPLIHKFICYDIDIPENTEITDEGGITAKLKKAPHNNFQSFDLKYNNKKYTYWHLVSTEPRCEHGMEIIVLKNILEEVLGAIIS